MKLKILIVFTFILMSVFSYCAHLSYKVITLTKHYPAYNSKLKEFVLYTKKPKNWVSIKNVSKHAKWAIIISEDWAFYDHEGLDFNQLEIVIKESLEQKKLVRGASTITQQLIKNALLNNEKTLFRKISEAYMAFMIEKFWTKDQILEAYLNIIHLGDDIYGIKQASAFYFKKKPNKLNAREGAFLAMLLPSPVKYSISFRKKELSKFALNQIDEILIKLRQAKIITDKERLKVLTIPFVFERQIPIDHVTAEDYF